MFLKNKKILITGCSFIGSHLLEKLIGEGVTSIRVVNLTDKHAKHFKKYLKEIEFYQRDLRNLNQVAKSVKDIDIVFHLASDHGGRGYVDLYQGKTASNLLLDGSVFYACLKEEVEKIIYTSSGCVYPNFLQKDLKKEIYLREEMVGPPFEADNIYGWGKLMGEMTLKAYYKDFGLKSAICRLFTVYGERASETHGAIASIAKAFIKQDPYQIWGDGQQIRNWTYVEDIVAGLLLAAEKINDAIAVNLGTTEWTKVIDMVEMIFKYTGFRPKKIQFLKMPTGPLNRVADNSLAKKLLGWQPKYSFNEGLKKTIAWYFSNHKVGEVKKNLGRLLLSG
jgi:nucleoside-diphosphate-sugar epimerase